MVSERPESLTPGTPGASLPPQVPGKRPLYNPAEEGDRLREIERLGIALEQPDASLQALVDRVAALYGVGLCTINLVLENRQVFKTFCGELPPELAATRDVGRENSLCSCVVASHIPLVIEDMGAEDEWREHYWHAVHDVRFYAGVPLVTSGGHALGTLCLADGQPRSLSGAEVERLQYFSRRIAAELQLSGAMERAHSLQRELETTARYSLALAELSVQLDEASTNADQTTACAALATLVEVGGLSWAALVITQEERSWSPCTAGILPAEVQRLLRRKSRPGHNPLGQLTGELLPLFRGPDGEVAAAEAEESAPLPGALACLPLGTSTPDVPSLLLAARDGGSIVWSAQDRRFLESGARILGASLRRSQRWQDLQTVSLTDELTGLRNRRALEQLLADPGDLARGCRVWVGDLHGFKGLNDSMGHAVGDACLREVAEALRSQLRPRDFPYLFRTGGDEFTLVLCGAPADLGARLQRAVALTAEADFRDMDLHLDVGEAAVPDETPDLSAALRLADTRMYETKRARRAAGR
jgi:diguanylate cyclase (GGDEF)-like protein